MKRAPIALAVAAVVAMATIVNAQKPDFAGTWTLDVEAGAGAGGATNNGPVTMTVKQTAETLTLEGENRAGNKQTRTYKLDGTESINTIGRGGQPIEARSTAKWDGEKLVITEKAADAERTLTWSMAAGTLTIESTGGGGGPAKRVYKKVS